MKKPKTIKNKPAIVVKFKGTVCSICNETTKQPIGYDQWEYDKWRTEDHTDLKSCIKYLGDKIITLNEEVSSIDKWRKGY